MNEALMVFWERAVKVLWTKRATKIWRDYSRVERLWAAKKSVSTRCSDIFCIYTEANNIKAI